LEFKEAYAEFIKMHCRSSDGERKGRLTAGHGHAERMFLENVWWPTFHTFKDLHPEYEIHDYKDGQRYLDFAYIVENFRMAIEIDGFGPHWRNISRWQFEDHCHRQNVLVIDGWSVLRFAYSQVEDRPRLCQQTIQQFIGRWLSITASLDKLSTLDRDILRLISRSPKPITPRDVCSLLKIGPDYAHKLLRKLTELQWLAPCSGKIRIRSYQLHPSRANINLELGPWR